MAVVMTTAMAAVRASGLVISAIPFGRLNTQPSLLAIAVTTTV